MPFIWVNSPKEFAQMVAEFTAAKVTRQFRQTGARIMATVEELETAINGQWEVLAPAVTEVQGKLRDLAEQVRNGATSDRLAELVADVNASTSQIAQGLQNAMGDPATPEPTVPAPDVENPLPGDSGTGPVTNDGQFVSDQVEPGESDPGADESNK